MTTKQIEAVCPQCKISFSYYPSQYDGGVKRYCSRKCQSDASRVVVNCLKCGKEFMCFGAYPRKYCSRECSASMNGRKNFGKYAEGVGFTEKTCESCGKLFMKPTRDLKKTRSNFCSLKCYGAYISKTRKGIPRPEVRGEKPHMQKRVTITCSQCGKIFKTKQSHKDRRKFCSRKCMIIWQSESGYSSGENSWNWKGGRIRYYGPNWHQQQRNARARDKYTCQRCGITENELGYNLDVHHKKPFRNFGIKRYKEANTLDNLISFCKVCHTTVEHNGL